MKKITSCLGCFAVSAVCCISTAQAYDAGWEGVNNYNGYASNLSNCISEGQKFATAINAATGWTTAYGFSDNSAWEEDFKKQSSGGTDNSYADNVDLVLFSGHGNSSGFYFGTTYDDIQLSNLDAEWGDQDLEWIIIDACQVLEYDSGGVYNRWGWNSDAFSGLHYIFGYDTVSYDVDTRGELFVQYATSGSTLREAWINATIISENGTKGAYLRADASGTDTYNDHLWGFGSVSSDPTSPTSFSYARWDT